MSNSSEPSSLAPQIGVFEPAPIVFVNGPFGTGKSTTVEVLAQRIPESLVIDPERVGHMLWSRLPAELRREEFELEPLWPPMTRMLIDQARRTYGRPVLVPMTIARPQVFDHIVGSLRDSGYLVRHYTLLAAPETIRARLKERMRHRGEGPDRWGELSWEGLQVERCLHSLRAPRFAHHISTDDRTPTEVADLIVSALHQEQTAG